ncbi:MAG TPA: hypothetical protein VHC72_00625, partial [Bryobacteraceae bacterium]|nr:hypothetical protein [Bryobacteraceae bacterium]
LDDAYDAGMLKPEQIAAAVPAYAEILESVETSYPGATEREQFQETLRHLIDGLVSGLIDGTVASAKSAGVSDVDSVRHYPERIVRFTGESGATSRELKRFLQKHVYQSPDLADDRTRSMERLSRLFAHLMEHPELLPGAHTEPTGDQPLHRIVCDYIAGMTDGYFERVYTAVLG